MGIVTSRRTRRSWLVDCEDLSLVTRDRAIDAEKRADVGFLCRRLDRAAQDPMGPGVAPGARHLCGAHRDGQPGSAYSPWPGLAEPEGHGTVTNWINGWRPSCWFPDTQRFEVAGLSRL